MTNIAPPRPPPPSLPPDKPPSAPHSYTDDNPFSPKKISPLFSISFNFIPHAPISKFFHDPHQSEEIHQTYIHSENTLTTLTPSLTSCAHTCRQILRFSDPLTTLFSDPLAPVIFRPPATLYTQCVYSLNSLYMIMRNRAIYRHHLRLPTFKSDLSLLSASNERTAPPLSYHH